MSFALKHFMPWLIHSCFKATLNCQTTAEKTLIIKENLGCNSAKCLNPLCVSVGAEMHMWICAPQELDSRQSIGPRRIKCWQTPSFTYKLGSYISPGLPFPKDRTEADRNFRLYGLLSPTSAFGTFIWLPDYLRELNVHGCQPRWSDKASSQKCPQISCH